jgi:hypothetical protein
MRASRPHRPRTSHRSDGHGEGRTPLRVAVRVRAGVTGLPGDLQRRVAGGAPFSQPGHRLDRMLLLPRHADRLGQRQEGCSRARATRRWGRRPGRARTGNSRRTPSACSPARPSPRTAPASRPRRRLDEAYLQPRQSEAQQPETITVESSHQSRNRHHQISDGRAGAIPFQLPPSFFSQLFPLSEAQVFQFFMAE